MDAKTLNKLINDQLPKKLTDLRIKHAPAYKILHDGNVDLNLMVQFLSLLTFIPESYLVRIDKDDIIEMFNYQMKMLQKVTLSGIPEKEIVINGKTYELIDPNKAPTGWHIDVERSDFDKDPVRLACICYIPKGTHYTDLDEHDNQLYPIADRYDDFKNNFLMIDFIELNTFFLLKLKRLTSAYTQKQKVKEQLQRMKNLLRLRGRK